ncbi:hypothetical protein RRG08_004894 [Elysia crispata]|uniref:Uncharacterized protein n=1 Tax=Elysia crispata TaxID=231223 RepID=A0AAE0ZHW0_9GAST|nr:hypothetical protein RRG08_004894 [Elysia crispata]
MSPKIAQDEEPTRSEKRPEAGLFKSRQINQCPESSPTVKCAPGACGDIVGCSTGRSGDRQNSVVGSVIHIDISIHKSNRLAPTDFLTDSHDQTSLFDGPCLMLPEGFPRPLRFSQRLTRSLELLCSSDRPEAVVVGVLLARWLVVLRWRCWPQTGYNS